MISGDSSAQEVVARLGIGESVIEAQGNLLRVADAVQATVLRALVDAAIPIVSLNPVSRTLEEVYVRTTETNDTTIRTSVGA